MAKKDINNSGGNDDKSGSDGGSENKNNSNNSDNKNVELTNAHVEAFLNTDRGKKLLEAKKTADQLQREKEQREEEKMKEQGKLQDLLDKEKTRVEELQNQLKTERVKNSIVANSNKLGIVDPEAAFKLINQDELELDDSGNVTNAESVLSNLIEQKPYLSSGKSSSDGNIGGGDNANSSNDGKPTYTSEQYREIMQDRSKYLANKEEYDAALNEGRVLN